MAQIINFGEIQAARRRSQQAEEREALHRAVALMRESLAFAANRLKDAPAAEHAELLERIENLTSMIRYGMRMLETAQGSGDPPLGPDRANP